MHQTKQNAQMGCGESCAQKESAPNHKNAKGGAEGCRANFSTATEAQQARVLAMLELRPHTSHELAQKGIYHPPRRIRELRLMGHPIATRRVNLIDEWGYTHKRCALYELEARA